MKKGFVIGLTIVGSICVLMAAYVIITIANYLNADKWELHRNIPDDRKDLYSNVALMPELSGSLDRYGIRGIRDFEYMVETKSYDSVDAMCADLPEGCNEGITKALEQTPHHALDIDGHEVAQYVIESGLPLVDKDSIDEKYKNAYTGAFISYYVLKYSDGTYRFAVDIRDT